LRAEQELLWALGLAWRGLGLGEEAALALLLLLLDFLGGFKIFEMYYNR
jgi:hypothetical protein